MLHVGLLYSQWVGTTLRRSMQASHCGGSSWCRAQALGIPASGGAVLGLSTLVHRRSCPAACRILVPGAEIEPVFTALARQILNRWTTREVPSDWLLIPEMGFFPCWSLIQMKSYIMNIMFVWWSRVLPARWLVPLPWYLVSHSMNVQLESILEFTSFSNYPLSILLPFDPFTSWSPQVVLVVKSPAANAGDLRDVSLISGSRRSPGGGQHNPLQYSCLENPMDRGAWRATVHGLAKSWTWLEQLSTHANPFNS